MALTSFGDLAQSYQLRSQNSQLKQTMDRLAYELASGQVADIPKAIHGDYRSLAEIHEASSALSAYKSSNAEAALFVRNAQTALELAQNLTGTAAPALLTASNSNSDTLTGATVDDTRTKMDAIIAAINTPSTGRMMFSGNDTNAPALASADVMLADLATLTAAETTASDIMTIVDAWFDDVGGGFETIGYTGSTDFLEPFQIGPGREADFEVNGADAAIREMLKGLAIAGLVAQGTMATDRNERGALLRTAGETLLQASDGIAGLRAKVGTAESHIEEISVQNETEIQALDLAKTELLAADPYTTATELESVSNQLETLYTITARLSRLSLVDFLR